MSLYEDAQAAGIIVGHHASDLYLEAGPVAAALLKKHGVKYAGFVDQTTGKPCIEVPFAYTPYFTQEGRRDGN